MTVRNETLYVHHHCLAAILVTIEMCLTWRNYEVLFTLNYTGLLSSGGEDSSSPFIVSWLPSSSFDPSTCPLEAFSTSACRRGDM